MKLQTYSSNLINRDIANVMATNWLHTVRVYFHFLVTENSTWLTKTITTTICQQGLDKKGNKSSGDDVDLVQVSRTGSICVQVDRVAQRRHWSFLAANVTPGINCTPTSRFMTLMIEAIFPQWRRHTTRCPLACECELFCWLLHWLFKKKFDVTSDPS